MHHATHCSTQSIFERGKRRDATGVLSLIGSRGRLRAFGRAGTLIGDDTLAEKSASTVLRQTFGAHDSCKKCWISEILFDRSQRFPAGEKHRSRPRRIIRGWNETRLLKFHVQHRVGLIKLRRPREVTQRQEKASQNANHDDPNTFYERMPITAKIECVWPISVLRCQRHAWCIGIGCNGRSPQRLDRVNHGRILAAILHQEVRPQRRQQKIAAKKYFRRR
jgi:hypothetical protein